MDTATILIGSDPEVFLRDSSTGNFASAHGVIPGNKQDPFEVPLGAVQVDGMACEFNTTPASTRQEFINNVTGVLSTMSEMIPQELELAVALPVAKFTPEVYDVQPREAVELGCEPDYNAYTGVENPRPNANNDARMRTAAGHIHIGWTQNADFTSFEHMQTCRELTKLLDASLGVFSLSYDKDTERRALYGKAGAFRPKSYGLEYRVLSNAWLKSEDLIGQVYDMAITTVSAFLEGAFALPAFSERAQSIINNSDFDAVDEHLTEVMGYLNG